MKYILFRRALKALSLSLLLFPLLFQGTGASAQKSKNDWLKTGSVLTYQITQNVKKYEFIISNLIIETNISFDWEMTPPNALTGSLVISRYALDTATAQKNYFQDGVTMVNDKTAVWVSKIVYQALKKKKPITISTGNIRSVLKFVSKETYSFTLNGEEKKVKALYGETNASEKFWILDDETNPLILKMDLGWTVELLSVQL